MVINLLTERNIILLLVCKWNSIHGATNLNVNPIKKTLKINSVSDPMIFDTKNIWKLKTKEDEENEEGDTEGKKDENFIYQNLDAFQESFSTCWKNVKKSQKN